MRRGHRPERSRMCTPHAEPRPMTWARPTFSSLDLAIAGAPHHAGGGRPPRCWQCRWQRDGCPFDSRPPDTLTGMLPSRRVAPELKKSTAPPSSQHQVVVVHQLGGGEAVVQLYQVEVARADARLLVGDLHRVASERVDVGQHLTALFVRVAGEHRGRHLDGPPLLLQRQRLPWRH